MSYLVLVSFIWAFSFGLIKGRLADLDPAFISAARLGLALVVFLPFFRIRAVPTRTALALIAIGAVQFGAMYLAYNASFQHLKAYEVALFTLTTPILVSLFADALDRKLRLRALLAALLAVAGAAVIIVRSISIAPTLTGFLLVQASNAAFAIGQVLYRLYRLQQTSWQDRDVFALLYAGAFFLTLPFALISGDFRAPELSSTQLWTLLYLGVLASGAGFFLWNLGAARVNTGTLAVFNNVKIPLAVACSLLFFGERADLPRLFVGGALMIAAIWLAERR